MKKEKFRLRIFTYLFGLFIMAIGVAVSIKANLGVSPVSSIPYTMTVVWGIEMGKATILFHSFVVFIQFLISRKDFKLKSLLEVVVGIIFGYYMTFCNSVVGRIPEPKDMSGRIALLVASVILVAIGLFFYLKANIMPMAAEGCMQAITAKTGMQFSKIKVIFDSSMVLISFTICMVVIHGLGSVGIGTILAAVLVGSVHGYFAKSVNGLVECRKANTEMLAAI